MRVWDIDSYEQLYQFDAPGDGPRCLGYHPHKPVVACGFDSGYVRVFGMFLFHVVCSLSFFFSLSLWLVLVSCFLFCLSLSLGVLFYL